MFKGYLRSDGSVGIRNKILIISVDECCDGVARGIAADDKDVVVLTNAYTCMLGGNEETLNQMIANAENPNVASVLVLAMGCGSIMPSQILDPLKCIEKPAKSLIIQQSGGTLSSIQKGRMIIKEFKAYIASLKREKFSADKLIIGIKCGGSDTSSGIASNPSVGLASDKLIDKGAVCIGGELFELQGCQTQLQKRASSISVYKKIERLINAELKRWSVEGTNVETMSIGNSVGGITTIEEKSYGALHKFGTKPIVDILEINDKKIEKPQKSGFYLSEATMLCGGAGVNFASYGAQLILWTSGAAGFENPIVPVIRVSGNEDLFNDDMDIDARGIMSGAANLETVSNSIVDKVMTIASGESTKIEGYGGATLTLYQKDQRLERLLKVRCKS